MAPRISVVIPTRNEGTTIGRVLDELARALGGANVEVLVVDTASTDRTVEIAMAKGARVIDEPRRGYGRAYKTGFAAAQGEYILTLDADGTYPPSAIPQLLTFLETNSADFVVGERMTRLNPESMSRQHRVGNWVLNRAVRVLFGLRLKDSQSGMWAFRRALLERLKLTSDGMAFSEELKVEVGFRGYRLTEWPIEYGARAAASSAKIQSWRDGLGNLWFLMKKRLSYVREG